MDAANGPSDAGNGVNGRCSDEVPSDESDEDDGECGLAGVVMLVLVATEVVELPLMV